MWRESVLPGLLALSTSLLAVVSPVVVSCGCHLFGEWGTRTVLVLSESLPAWESSWAAMEICTSPKAPGGRRMSAPGPGNHNGVSLQFEWILYELGLTLGSEM